MIEIIFFLLFSMSFLVYDQLVRKETVKFQQVNIYDSLASQEQAEMVYRNTQAFVTNIIFLTVFFSLILIFSWMVTRMLAYARLYQLKLSPFKSFLNLLGKLFLLNIVLLLILMIVSSPFLVINLFLSYFVLEIHTGLLITFFRILLFVELIIFAYVLFYNSVCHHTFSQLISKNKKPWLISTLKKSFGLVSQSKFFLSFSILLGVFILINALFFISLRILNVYGVYFSPLTLVIVSTFFMVFFLAWSKIYLFGKIS